MDDQKKTDFFAKFPPPYLIVGLGKSGKAVQRLLLHIGAENQNLFTLDDKAPANFSDGEDALQKSKACTLVVSPGYPLSTPWLVQAKNQGLVITSELSLAAFFLTTEKLIGVTGSVGKSTVCALLGYAFEKINEPVLVCGNFGFPLADYVVDVLEKKFLSKKWLVVELSSYQLENCADLRLNVAALTSLTANHLERYATKLHYYASKLNIFQLCVGKKICASNSPGLFSFLDELAAGDHKQILLDMKITQPLSDLLLADLPQKISGVMSGVLSHGQVFFDVQKSTDLRLPLINNSKLIGNHNVFNILLCMAIFRISGFGQNADHFLLEYTGLPHRLENLGERNKILFINDSKATALESVLTAADTLTETYPQRPAWILLGGRDKNLPWQDLSRLGKNKNFKFLFFGECGQKAQHTSGLSGPTFPRLSEAFIFLQQTLNPNNIVLFSPGGTSLDEFKNFEERGEFFRTWVQKSF